MTTLTQTAICSACQCSVPVDYFTCASCDRCVLCCTHEPALPLGMDLDDTVYDLLIAKNTPSLLLNNAMTVNGGSQLTIGKTGGYIVHMQDWDDYDAPMSDRRWNAFRPIMDLARTATNSAVWFRPRVTETWPQPEMDLNERGKLVSVYDVDGDVIDAIENFYCGGADVMPSCYAMLSVVDWKSVRPEESIEAEAIKAAMEAAERLGATHVRFVLDGAPV